MDNGLFKPTTIGTPQGGVDQPATCQSSCSTSSIGDWRKKAIALCGTPMTSSSCAKRSVKQAEAALKLVGEIMTELGL